MTDVSKVTKDFVQQSIQKGQREDGRGLLELRQLQIIFNFEEDGHYNSFHLRGHPWNTIGQFVFIQKVHSL